MVGRTRLFRFAAGSTLMWPLLFSMPARAQESTSPAPAARRESLQQSVQTLADEVKQLNATIQELRGEVQQSRQETREMRQQLNGAMEKLSATAAAAPGRTATMTAAEERTAILPPVAEADTPTEERLSRLEEDQQMLQAKVDEQHQTKVESASKYRVKLSGIALFNLFGNSGTVDNQDVPGAALPPGALATTGSVGATVRQSEIGLAVYGPQLAGARTSANVNFDFFGGFSSVTNGVTSDLVRMRTATVRLDWDRTSLVGGQDAPFFSPLSPTSFASVGYPAFAEAGNLWTWTPQLMVEHRFNPADGDVFLLQGGILDPLSGEPPYSQFYRTPQSGEQSRQPAVASRLAWAHGAAGHAVTVGVGGYYSRQNYGAGRTTDAWAATADWDAPLGRHFALSGEFYRGRALGGLGAAQGRSVVFDGSPTDPTSDLIGLNTVGGWTQLKFKPTETVEFNAAYGQENPFARDLRYAFSIPSSEYGAIAKNQNALFNVVFRPRSDLLFALEYRYLQTMQISSSPTAAGTLNLSMGVLF